MILPVEGTQPRSLQIRKSRRDARYGVHKLYLPELLDQEAITGHEMPDLMVGIVEHQGHRIELIRALQSVDQPLQQFRERARPKQLQLALLCLAQQRLVTGPLLLEVLQALLQTTVVAL